jgi:hypothetical protein
MTDPLSTWNDGPTKAAIEFRRPSLRGGFGRLGSREERVATFDNDGTLWCEKPMPSPARLLPCASWSRWLRRTQPCATGSRGRRPRTDHSAGTRRFEHYAATIRR